MPTTRQLSDYIKADPTELLKSFGASALGNRFGLGVPARFRVGTTITPTVNTTSQIASGVTIGADDPDSYTFYGGERAWLTDTSGHKVCIAPSGAILMKQRSFCYDSQTIEIKMRTVSGANFGLAVNGEFVAYVNVGSSNQPSFFLFDFGSAATRRIEVFSRYEYWNGLVTEPGAVIAPHNYNGPTFAMMGDSLTAGTGGAQDGTVARIVAECLDILDFRQFGYGGSGYVNNAGGAKFINRIAEFVLAPRDLYVIAGGENDLGSSLSAFETDVDAFYTALLAEGIDPLKIVIVGMFSKGDPTPTRITFHESLRAKAAEIGAHFIDPLGVDGTNPWIFGTGRVGTPAGDGNADFYAGSDGSIHWSPDGHVFVGKNIARELIDL